MNLFDIAAVEIGQHFYWYLGDFQIHGQVLLNSWFVIAVILLIAVATTRDLQKVPGSGQNFIEFFLEFIRDISATQIGEDSVKWVPFFRDSFPIYFRIKLDWGFNSMENY